MARSTLLLTLLALLALPATADAQSASELREENRRLNTENRDLKTELEAARGQIAQLAQRIAQLEAALRNSGTVPPPMPGGPATPAADQVTIDESVPSASPRALFNALKASYEKTMADQERGRQGDTDRRAYLKALRAWSSRVDREFRDQISWHVRLSEPEQGGRAVSVLAQAVDPGSGAKLGEAFRLVIPRAQSRRIDPAWLEDDDPLVLRGVLQPQTRVNPEREAPGAFDNPRLIGPFAEFVFTIDVKSLMPPEQDEAENGDEKKSRSSRGGPTTRRDS